MKLRFFSSLAAGLLGAVSAANALDPIPASGHDWSGAYIGAHAGAAWGDVDATLTSISGSYETSGWLAGAQAGWNLQNDALVLGIVVDASFADVDGNCMFDPGPPQRFLDTNYDFLSTARVRLGWASDAFLIYGTGGLALGSADSSRSLPAADTSDLLVGFAVGAGFELAVGEQWSLQVEYLHRDLGNQALDNYDLDHTVDTLTAGFNFAL
jgi:outer membrane immunogenic protein